MSAAPATGRSADADAWNAWADRINAKALAAGLVTAEQLAAQRTACQAALARLTKATA
jgi:hypothetical protein